MPVLPALPASPTAWAARLQASCGRSSHDRGSPNLGPKQVGRYPDRHRRRPAQRRTVHHGCDATSAGHAPTRPRGFRREGGHLASPHPVAGPCKSAPTVWLEEPAGCNAVEGGSVLHGLVGAGAVRRWRDSRNGRPMDGDGMRCARDAVRCGARGAALRCAGSLSRRRPKPLWSRPSPAGEPTGGTTKLRRGSRQRGGVRTDVRRAGGRRGPLHSLHPSRGGLSAWAARRGMASEMAWASLRYCTSCAWEGTNGGASF